MRSRIDELIQHRPRQVDFITSLTTATVFFASNSASGGNLAER